MRKSQISQFYWGAIWCVLFPVASAAVPCQDADLFVRNAHIITMDSVHSSASAMAVRDGRILAIGSDSEISGCASERTRKIDLHGETVLPGLIDVHTMRWSGPKGFCVGSST